MCQAGNYNYKKSERAPGYNTWSFPVNMMLWLTFLHLQILHMISKRCEAGGSANIIIREAKTEK